MSRFRLHAKLKGREYQRYMLAGFACFLVAAAGLAVYSIGTARAKSRETVMIYTEEEFEQYLLDRESEEFNLNGRYQLKENLDLSRLEYSIGTNIEPFTGNFDGNGHVINGLARPLFGVTKNAEIENLLLEQAEIVHPFTYSDEKGYVDGYAALVAYARDTVIKNCGMTGEIYVASPAEAVYQVAKASPSNAEECFGPGRELPDGPAGDVAGDVESSEKEKGPGIESETSVESESEAETEDSSENETGTEPGDGSENETGTETGDGSENETEREPGDGLENEIGTEPESGSEVETGTQPGDSSENGTETRPGDGGESETGTQPETSPDSNIETTGSDDVPVIQESESGEKDHSENMETIGYRPIDRLSLSMKVPAVMEPDAESALPASPAEAEPSNREESSEAPNKSTEDLSGGDNSLTSGMEEEYIGNPDDDIYILVTADRAVSGGLTAQAAGNTLISNCFTLVNIYSEWEGGASCAGGMAGILGGEVRTENSYASGLVDCGDTIAGFAAVNQGEIQNCYSSAAVGQRAAVRGAFTAKGQGYLSGCVYDRQMSCTGEENDWEAPQTGFALKGLNTVEMTGYESQVPGDWYTTDQAYPQIAYFAEHEQEIYAIDSKVSAIALILPEGITLEDAVSEEGIVLPAEIDGQEIQWETEVDAEIISVNPVMLRSNLAGDSLDETADAEPDETVPATPGKAAGPISEASRLTAQINGTSKTFQLRINARAATGTWDSVVVEKGWDENYLRNHTVTLPDGSTLPMLGGGDGSSEAAAYSINSPEAFAWFSYQINNSYSTYQSKCAVLGADINLSGETYGGSPETPLLWSPMGTVSSPFKCVLDGAGMTIDYLNINHTGSEDHIALVRYLGGGTLKNITIGKNSQVTSNGRMVAAFAGGGGNGTIRNCINYATITGREHTAGIIGVLSDGTTNITQCANLGTVTSQRISGGIVSYTRGSSNRYSRVTQCYNQGTIVTTGSSDARVAGICPANDNDTGGNRIFSNCYNAGELQSSLGKGYTYALLRYGVCGNSYVDSTIMPPSSFAGTNGAKFFTTKQMQSWAAAYALNGQNTTGVWKYTEGEYPSFGQLEKAESWEVIGLGVEDGLITAGTVPAGKGTAEEPYQIGNGEQLAWFAYKVNQGNWDLCAQLVNEISLAGTNYGTDYSESSPLPWNPIAPGSKHGDTENVFKGIFDGQLHTISYMNIKGSFTKDVQSGFFGIVTGIVRNVYIDKISMDVKTTSYVCVGAIAGQADLQAVIENCGVLSGSIKGSFSGSFSAVGGILGDMRGYSTIQNCFNRANVECSSLGKNSGHASGIAGRGGRAEYFKNCYNTGSVSGTRAWTDGITSKHGGARADVINCMVEAGTCPVTYSRVPSYSNSSMKSWAAGFALNGQSMDGAWAYTSGQYPHFGTLARPDSWQVVGQGILDNLVKGITLTPDAGSGVYNIGAPEQLAVFGALVNNGNVNINASLTMDINLTGVRYGGNMTSPIPWYPIGDESNVYRGTFEGAGKAIGHMSVEKDGLAGFFGCAGGGAVITGVGVDSTCKITSTGTTSGNGAAALVALVKSDETAVTQIKIQNCYSRAEVTGAGTGAFTGGMVGNYLGTSGGSETISNCYNTGKIAAAGGTVGSAIAGTFSHGTGGGIKNCYWDSQTSGGVTAVVTGGGAAVENCGGKTTAVMKSDGASGILDGLNANLGTGTWYRVDTRNDGYPIYKKSEREVTWADVGAAVLAPQSKMSSASPGTESDPYLLWTPEDMAWFAYQVNQVSGKTGLCAELMADINLFGETYSGHAYDTSNPGILSKAVLWIPIGDGTNSYTGTFQGNRHTVRIMRAGELTAENQGLFGTIGDGARITGLTVSESQVMAARYSGGIAGSINGTGVVVDDCQITGTLTGEGDYFGGIAGLLSGGGVTISGCRNTGEIAGTGNYVGGIAGAAQTAGSIVIDGCYSSVTGKTATTGSSKAHIGGILGGGLAGNGTVTVRNCYNRGTVSSDSSGSETGGIAGSSGQNTVIKGCYNTGQVTGGSICKSIAGVNTGTGNISDCFYQSGCPADAYAKEVSQVVLQTWGAAFALNGKQLSQSTGISWIYDAGNNDGYPYPDVNALRDAYSWEEVGEAAFHGLIDGAVPGISGNAYQIGTAEQLAWFAYRVNQGEKAINADLTANIDMGAAESSYVSAGRLSWMPIGSDAITGYQGVFQSSPANNTIYQIQNLYVNDAALTKAGLFGGVSGDGRISRIGIVNVDVTGTSAGGIVGELSGNGEVSRCYNRGGTVTGSQRAGGIAGQLINSGGIIKDCYNMNAAIAGNGASGANAGGIVGYTEGDVKNCYNANLTGGSIVGTGGSYAIASGLADKVKQCYSDSVLGDSAYVGQMDCSEDAKLQTQTNLLNTLDGSERKENARVWFTSLASEETKGLPTLDAPEICQIELSPAAEVTGTTESLGGGISIPDAVLRGIHLVKDSTSADTIHLTAADTMSGNFYIYGTDNANVNLGIKAGTTDVSGLAQSLTAPKASLGTVNQLTLYTAAAYTHAAERILLLEVSSGTRRYEIWITIPGASSKTLSVILPVEVPIELSPNGTFQRSCSADLALTNLNGYPISGKILRLTPKDDPGYAVLTPVAKDDPFGGTKQIADPSGGVRIGITDIKAGNGIVPASGIYYTPAKPLGVPPVEERWMEYQIRGQGVLPYRYFIEYEANPYYRDTNQYGYTVSYEFGISKEDITGTADAVVK